MPSSHIADRIPLRYSEPPRPAGSTRLGPVDPSEPIVIAIRVRRRAGTNSPSASAHGRPQGPAEREGADPADLDRIQEFARQMGLNTIELSPTRRSVVVWGTAAAIAEAFRVELAHYMYAGRVVRAQLGPVYLPRTIAAIIEDVSGLDEGLPAVTPPAHAARPVPRFSARQVAISLSALVIGGAVSSLLLSGNVSEHSAAPGAAVPAGQITAPGQAHTAPQNAPPPAARATRRDLDLAALETTAWKLLDAGHLRDAQTNFLRVLSLNPARHDSMRGLVAVERKMGADDPSTIRKQVAVYQDALKRGIATDENYTPSELHALVSAGLTAVHELETQARPAAAGAPPSMSDTAAPPPLPTNAPGSANGQLPHSAATAVKPAPVHKPVPSDGKVPPPAQAAVRASLETPRPATRPTGPAVTAATQGLAVPGGPVTSHAVSPPPAPSRHAPASPPALPPAPAAAAPPASHTVYMVRVGPVTDRDRADAIAKQLAAGGFLQPQISAQPGYRVLSEPLPRQAAGRLAETLAAQGLRSYPVALTGDTVQLVFGSVASQKDADKLAGRVAAAGYDAWVREAQVYTLQLGPYPQAAVNAITALVHTGSPEATVAADAASAQAGASPPPAGALYMLRIGPVSDRDRAAAVARQLSAQGFARPKITAQAGYRVVSEPLPRRVAEDLAATLGRRGFRVYPEPLRGDSVQLLFGIFASPQEAEALSSRVAAVGYDAWIREGPVYMLHLGPYPQSAVNTITGIVRAGAPESTVVTDPASTP